MALIFQTMRGRGDNLSYVIGCSSQRVALVVDPTSPHALMEFCASKKLILRFVLNTHGHPDHTAGNKVIVNATGAQVLGHVRERIPGLDRTLEDGDIVTVGKVQVKVLHLPGHTPGGLGFRIGSRFLSGDTVFVAGAGNTRFGGNVKDLFETFDKKIMALPDRTELCPGHDYALSNLRFARSLEPDNPDLEAKLREVRRGAREKQLIKSSLAEEKRYNPFFRYREPAMIRSLMSEYPDRDLDNPFEVFRLIRELRNQWG
jgi:hydroxyacylglutathione hydrolase